MRLSYCWMSDKHHRLFSLRVYTAGWVTNIIDCSVWGSILLDEWQTSWTLFSLRVYTAGWVTNIMDSVQSEGLYCWMSDKQHRLCSVWGSILLDEWQTSWTLFSLRVYTVCSDLSIWVLRVNMVSQLLIAQAELKHSCSQNMPRHLFAQCVSYHFHLRHIKQEVVFKHVPNAQDLECSTSAPVCSHLRVSALSWKVSRGRAFPARLYVPPAKTPISLCIQAVWSETLQGSLWVDKDPVHLQAYREKLGSACAETIVWNTVPWLKF